MVRNDILKKYDFDDYSRQPVSFYYCQAGFHPDGFKPVYVWTREEYARGTTVLRNCATKKNVAIPLVSQGVNIWGRQGWLADCSDVSQEGDYILRVKFGGDFAETVPFPISGKCYTDLQEKAAKHFFLKRCGIFCHVHDGDLYSLESGSLGKIRRHVRAGGGWHDAHDDNKWIPFIWMAVYGLLKTEERFAPQWEGANESYPYCLAEAWWEVDWLLRMQKPDGTFYHGVFEWFPRVGKNGTVLQIHHREQNYDDLHRDRRAVVDVWGENAICGLLGRPRTTSPSTAPKYFAYCAHVIRYCGRLLRQRDEKNTERCAQAAAKTVAYLERLKNLPPYQKLEVHAGLALYYLEDARDGGGQASLRQAEKHLAAMLSLQQPEGHFHASGVCRGLEAYSEEAGDERVFVDYPFGYIFAFIEYLECAAKEKRLSFALRGKVRMSLLRFAGMLEKFCRVDAFRHPTEIRFDGRAPAVIIPPRKAIHGYNPYILSAGAIFAAANRLAGFSDGMELGQRQLHWVLGANPRFMSFMNQVGVRNSGQYAAASSVTWKYYPMAFYRHLRDMRWGVTTGIFGPLEEDLNDGIERRASYPQAENYPNAGNSMYGTYDNIAQETWVNANGWLLMLLAQLTKPSE